MPRPDRWISGPFPDGSLAFSWVPFALVAHTVESNGALLRSVVGAVMFLSFSHQPLTLPLVYGSPWRLSTHRRLFLASPVAALAVVLVFSQVSLVLLSIVGALWNAEHTVMQRYGITRMYGRKAGDGQGGIEKVMYLGWLAIPLLWVTARGSLVGIVGRLSTGNIDDTALRVLARMSAAAGLLLPVMALVVGSVTARWLLTEARSKPNQGKWLYVASTAALLGSAFIDPIAAVVGLVGSHSIEYFVLVNRSVASESRHRGPLGSLVRLRHGRLAFFAVYGAATIGLFLVLYRLAPPRVMLVTVLTVGALHFFYDSFIWKLRRPEVAASLAVPARLASR